jgi:hypothetical protein
MSTISSSHHGTHLRTLGLGSALTLAASLLVGGCYEGSLARDVDEEMAEMEEIDEEDDLDVDPIDSPCGPTMHVFPVADAHNIGYDSTCNDYNCDISCPDLHANSDWGGDHHGIDVFAYRGAPLVAVTSGTIQKVGVAIKADGTPSTTSGIRVRLRDDCGWEYYYGHLDEAVVSEGQRVEPGQLLGHMGNTGTSGVHLHFNISPDGAYSNDIDPFDLLKATSPTACGEQPDAPEPEPEPQPPAGECDSVLAPDEALYRNQSLSSCNGQYTLVMQSDGNFVLYDGVGNALWHAGTHGHPGAAMRVEEDGNVVVWEGWTAIWKAR